MGVKHGFSLSWNINVDVAEDSAENILNYERRGGSAVEGIT